MPNNITDIVNFDEDYYEILGLTPDDIPSGKDPSSRRLATTVLKQAYHTKLFEVHPDRPGGDEEKCKLVVKAHMILSDPVLRGFYDNGGSDSIATANGLQVNWNKIGRYRSGSLADMIGSALFEKILKESQINGISVRFKPEDENSHNYHWEFEVEGLQKELVLSIVEDEKEVLRLTGSDEASLNNALPFKIYICLPSIKLVLARDEDEFLETPTGYLDVIRGRINNARFIDADILGTTNYENAIEFITSGKLKEAVEKCISGDIDEFLKKFKQREDNTETSALMQQQEVNRRDQSQLKALLEQANQKERITQNAV